MYMRVLFSSFLIVFLMSFLPNPSLSTIMSFLYFLLSAMLTAIFSLAVANMSASNPGSQSNGSLLVLTWLLFTCCATIRIMTLEHAYVLQLCAINVLCISEIRGYLERLNEEGKTHVGNGDDDGEGNEGEQVAGRGSGNRSEKHFPRSAVRTAISSSTGSNPQVTPRASKARGMDGPLLCTPIKPNPLRTDRPKPAKSSSSAIRLLEENMMT